MARINLDTIKKIEKEKNAIHSKVTTTYSVFEEDSNRYIQIDTYGSNDRAIPGKISQSIQFDRESAKFLVKLLINENGVKLIGFTSILSEAMDWLKNKASAAASASWSAIRAGMSGLGETLSHAWNATTSSFSGLTNNVSSYLDSLTGFLGDTYNYFFGD